MRTLFIYILMYLSIVLLAQKENNQWYFGARSILDFNYRPPKSYSGNAMEIHEGSASIADSDGNLLFYTNSNTIWNRDNNIMNNGINLLGPYGSAPNGFSFSQSAIIVPDPGDSLNEKYYVFSLGTKNSFYNAGLRYSIVDMTLLSGQGDVELPKAIQISGNKKVTEKLTAVLNRKKDGYWVAIHLLGSDSFYTYEITKNGVSSPVISKVGLVHNTPLATVGRGSMKFSHDGRRLGVCIGSHQFGGLQIFNFDDSSGVISNPITLVNNVPNEPFLGLEFSPDNSKLYVTKVLTAGTDTTLGSGSGGVFQYDLSVYDSVSIINSVTQIHDSIVIYLQLAPDNKIYCKKQSNTDSIAVIHCPNELGVACNFQDKAVYLYQDTLYNEIAWGMPNFISGTMIDVFDYQYDFEFVDACVGDSVIFNPTANWVPAEWNWNFGDMTSGSGNVSSEKYATHVFSDSGNYEITLIISNYCGINDTMKKTLIIKQPVDYQSIVNGSDTESICLMENETIELKSETSALNYIWFPDSMQSKNIFVNDTGKYTLEIIDINKCVVTKTISIIDSCIKNMYEIFIPNAVTLNNTNSYFITLNGVENIEIRLYDRFGNLKYSDNNLHNKKINDLNPSNKLKEGVYIYDITGKFETGIDFNYTGNILLLR